MNDVRIYELDRGFSLWVWLCPACLEARELLGWEVKESRPAIVPLTCDDCTAPGMEQGSPF